MKVFALSAMIATASAALGDDCFYDATICDPDGLACAKWEDSQYGPMASCEDCSEGDQSILDSYGDSVTYECPPKEDDGSSSGGDTPAPAPPSGEEEKASTIALSAAVLLAASTIYA